MTQQEGICGLCKDDLGDELVVERNGRKAHASCYQALLEASA